MNTPRSTVRRAAERADYDPTTVHTIVDEAWLCHVAFIDQHTGPNEDQGEPFPVSIPMACWRVADQVYIHGSNGSRLVKRLAGGAPVCLSITHLDGLVLARSAYSHSMNYRSVVVFGRFEVVPEADKASILDAFMDHIAPGRRQLARPADVNELKSTTVLGLSLREASAKVRTGGPKDKEGDLNLPVWAGVLPMREQHLPPQAEPDCASWPLPDHLSGWGR